MTRVFVRVLVVQSLNLGLVHSRQDSHEDGPNAMLFRQAVDGKKPEETPRGIYNFVIIKTMQENNLEERILAAGNYIYRHMTF